MKYCEKYVPALSALIDGELNDTERAEVLAHLEECEGCREFFAELTAMHAALGELEEFDAPDGFADGVMARLHESPKKRTPRAAWLSLAACAAIVVLAVGGPLRSQFGAKSVADSAAPEAAMLTMAKSEECAEEEYTDEYASVQSAPMTMMADSAAPEDGFLLGAGDCKENVSEENGIAQKADGLDAPVGNAIEETGEADSAVNDAYSNDANSNESNANDASFANEVPQLPRSVVFVYGAAREDYLIDAAVSFDYDADGTVAGYDLPVEKLEEFLTLLDADGLTYESSVAKQATTFYVQYEEGNANG